MVIKMIEFRCPMNDGGVTKAFSSKHWGVDYGYVENPYSPVMAIADGEVVDNFYSDSCGYSIVIKHPVGNGKHRFCTFIHLKSKSELSIGTKVKQGDTVGIRGNTGKSNGVHLHFGLTSETDKSYTWNIVKLDNKFYKIDTTGRVFLGAISQSELSDNLLNISNSKYSRDDLPNINFSMIDNYLNEAKSLKTTTTRTAILFPTKKTTKEFKIPNSQTKTNKTKNTTKTEENKTITSIKYENGTTQVYVVTLPTTKNAENENSRVEQQNKKLNLNFILIPLLIIVIIIYTVYKILLKKKKDDINEQQSM